MPAALEAPCTTLSRPSLHLAADRLLRYCLSFEEAKREGAVRRCLAWRKENASLLADAAAGKRAPHHDTIQRYCVAAYHKHATKLGEPLYVVRAGVFPRVQLAPQAGRVEPG